MPAVSYSSPSSPKSLLQPMSLFISVFASGTLPVRGVLFNEPERAAKERVFPWRKPVGAGFRSIADQHAAQVNMVVFQTGDRAEHSFVIVGQDAYLGAAQEGRVHFGAPIGLRKEFISVLKPRSMISEPNGVAPGPPTTAWPDPQARAPARPSSRNCGPHHDTGMSEEPPAAAHRLDAVIHAVDTRAAGLSLGGGSTDLYWCSAMPSIRGAVL